MHPLVLSLLRGVAILALFLPPAAIALDALPPLRESVFLEHGGWVAWRVFVPSGSQVGGQVRTALSEGIMAIGALWMRPFDSAELIDDHITAWKGESRVRLQAKGLDPLDVQVGTGAMSPISTEETVTAAVDQEWLVVVLSAADGPHEGTAFLYADPQVVVRGRTHGTGFLHRLGDFEGEMVWARSAATLRATQGASFQEGSDAALVAGFLGGADASELTIQGPSTKWTGEADYMIWSEEPGAHRFTIRDGAQVSRPCLTSIPGPVTCGVPDIRAFGAAITLP